MAFLKLGSLLARFNVAAILCSFAVLSPVVGASPVDFIPSAESDLIRVTLVGFIAVDESGFYLSSKGARSGDPFAISVIYDPTLTSSLPGVQGVYPIDSSTAATISFSGLVYSVPNFRAAVVNNLLFGGRIAVDGHSLQGTVPASDELDELAFTSVLYSTNTSLVGDASSYEMIFAQRADYDYLHFFRLEGRDRINSYPNNMFYVSGDIAYITAVPSSTVQVTPFITAHPANQSPTEGQSAQFKVSASGVPSPVLQWQRLVDGARGWINLSEGGSYSGVHTDELSVVNATAAMSGDQFRCVALSSSGVTASDSAILMVAGVAPKIVAHPTDQTTAAGQIAQFSVMVSANPLPAYQWQRQSSGGSTWTNISDGGAFSGTASAALTINTILAFQGDQFRCVVTNNQGSTISNSGRLMLLAGVPAVIGADSGKSHTVFIGTNGDLWGMGDNASGQLGLGGGVNTTTEQSFIAANTSGIWAGKSVSFYLKPDGTLWGAGFNGFGQFGAGGSWQYSKTPLQVASNVIQAAAGDDFTMHIKRDLTLWGAGRNNRGQLGTGDTRQRSSWEQVATNVIWVTTGPVHTLFVKSDGTLWGMGGNDGGQLGDGTQSERRTPTLIASNVIKAFAGSYVSYFIKADNTLWGMGSNGSGQLGDNSTVDRLDPVFIANDVVFVATSLSGEHTLFIKTDASLWGMGSNGVGQLGIGPTTTVNQVPVLIANNVIVGSTGDAFSTFAKSDGTYWGMGRSTPDGRLGFPVHAEYFFPRLISVGSITSPAAPTNIAATDGDFSSGVAITWSPSLGATSYEVWRHTINDAAGAVCMATNVATSLFWDGTAVTGSDYFYWVKAQNGEGTSFFSGSDAGFVSPMHPLITAKSLGSLDRVVLTWTRPTDAVYFELWRGIEDNFATATLLASDLTDPYFEDITASLGVLYYYFVRPVKVEGGFGLVGSAEGHLGSFVVNAPLTTRYVIAPGESAQFSVSVNGEGPLDYQWFHNGRLISGAKQATYALSSATHQDRGWYVLDISDGVSVIRSAPIFVAVAPEISRVRLWGARQFYHQPPEDLGQQIIAVDGMSGSTIALRRDGTVASWGSISASYPTPAGLSGVVAISAGVEHHVALKSDGTVVAWGSNGANLLNVPAGLTNVVDIKTSDYATLALKSDGTVVAWGGSDHGSTRVPPGLTNVVAIAASLGHAIALKADGTVVGWGPASFGLVDLSWLSSIKAIAGGFDNFAAIKTDGTVVQWSHSWAEPAGAVIWPGLSDVVGISVGSQHVLALKSDGTVVGRGTIEFGETLIPLQGESTIPSDLGLIHAIDAGQNLSFALDSGDVALVAPTVTQQPLNQSVPSGGTATFTVQGAGSTFSYLWERRVAVSPEEVWASVAGSMGVEGDRTPTLSVVNNPLFGDEQLFRCLLLSDAGYVVSNSAILTTTVLPVIATQPRSQTVDVGSTVIFSVVATGSTQFQWRFDGNNLPFANGASLTLSSVTPANGGSYSVVVSNAAGSVTSDFATLTVNPVGYAAYNQEHFTTEELADMDISGPNADPDRDGFTNLLEYGLGLDPKSTASAGLPEVGTTTTDWTYTYSRPSDRTDVSYAVEVSTNLTTWTTADVTHEFLASADGIETWQARYPLTSAANAFFRLKVRMP